MGPIRNPNWSTSGMRVTLSYLITANVVSSNPAHGKVYSIQHYILMIVQDLRQVGGFLRFHPQIELIATI